MAFPPCGILFPIVSYTRAHSRYLKKYSFTIVNQLVRVVDQGFNDVVKISFGSNLVQKRYRRLPVKVKKQKNFPNILKFHFKIFLYSILHIEGAELHCILVNQLQVIFRPNDTATHAIAVIAVLPV